MLNGNRPMKVAHANGADPGDASRRDRRGEPAHERGAPRLRAGGRAARGLV